MIAGAGDGSRSTAAWSPIPAEARLPRRRSTTNEAEVRRAFKEERHGDLQDMREVLQAARAHTVRSLLVFLHLLEREPEPIGELRLVIPSINRRIRTRLPTCLSTEWVAFVTV